MAKTTPSVVGAWPAPIPFGTARAGVWLDGSTASAAIAHWLSQAGCDWVALIDHGAHRPTRAHALAQALATALGAPTRVVVAEGPITTPLGWAKAATVGMASGATWLVLPALSDDAEPPLPLRLHAAETALVAQGLAGCWAPLLGWDGIAVGRLALALGVPFALTWECEGETACHQCRGCRERERAFKQLGMADPNA